MDKPRDKVEEWEFRVRDQFAALKDFAKENRCTLKLRDLPPRACGKSGQEHEVFQAKGNDRVWKSTFPGEAGRGPFGFYTPAAYLHRLRLSNRIFGDDVAFEGIWQRRDGACIVTSQRYIQPHAVRFIPTEDETEAYLHRLDFAWDESAGFWVRDEDGDIYAIDVQPRLPIDSEFEDAIPFGKYA